MDLTRITRHLLTSDRQARRAFPPATLLALEHAVADSECTHTGQIRVVVEAALDGLPLFRGQSARERAIELFAKLRIWDTEHNNGVLIYLLLADRAVEVVSDRALQGRVAPSDWSLICRGMEAAFSQRAFESGALAGVHAISQHLVALFPATGRPPLNELPDPPLLIL